MSKNQMVRAMKMPDKEEKQVANASPKGIIRYEETFATDNIAAGTPGSSDGSAGDGVAWLDSGDSGNTAIVRAVNASRGLHAAGATDATNNDMIEINGDTLMFYGQIGHNAAEILVQFDDVTNVAFNFGFNDEVLEGANTLPVELSTATFTLNAADAFVGFVYDTAATNDELHVYWADDGTATSTAIADLRMRGMAPTNSQWLYMRVELADRGSGNGVRATFLAVDHNGRSVEKVFNTSVDRDVALCYYFGMENRSASVHNVYIKRMAWEQGIA